jgi:Fe-S cluster biosynthesis and repair protein YggX
MSNPDLQDRIAQFRKMAQDDPENELGHFRLGQLLLEDGQVEDAARSFQRTLVLSPAFSKVYHLLAQCQVQLGRRDEAVRTLKEGYKVADQRGDKMPRDDMAKLLTELGEEVPATPQAVRGPQVGEIACQRPGCVNGGYGPKLPGPPIPDEIGRRIADTVCADCWQDWLRNYSIKVINELRLDLSSEFGQEEYDKYMHEFFGFDWPAKP